MNEDKLKKRISKAIKKSTGKRPETKMDFVTSLFDLRREGKEASYRNLIKRVYSKDRKNNENWLDFSRKKRNLLSKMRIEINERLFNSDLCFKFFIDVDCGQFPIIENWEEIYSKRLQELEKKLEREKSKEKQGIIRSLIAALDKKNKYFQTDKDSRKLFSEKNDDYVRFVSGTEQLDYSSLIDPLGFSIPEATEDMFTVKREVNEIFVGYLKNEENILIEGPMKVGKTRLVFDELRKLKNYCVFSLKQESFSQINKLSISHTFNQEKRKLIWFIDDLQYFSNIEDVLWTMYEKLTTHLGAIQVIATLRTDIDKEVKSQLIKYMTRLKVKKWSEKEGYIFSNHYGYDMKKFDGTPFSLIKRIDKMNDLYESYVRNKKLNRVYVMRYLTLLKEFLALVQYDTLKDTYLYLRENASLDDFEVALFRLEQAGFLEGKSHYVSSWEPYLEEIVKERGYSLSHMDSDMDRLLHMFKDNRDSLRLLILGWYSYDKKRFRRSIECHKSIIAVEKDTDIKAIAYDNWGTTLVALGDLKKDENSYLEACEKYAEAITYREDYPEAYYNWGTVLGELGDLKNDENSYLEACEKYAEAITYREDYPEAYNNWGSVLVELGDLKNDENSYLEACEKYALAIKYREDFAEAYYNWGTVLGELGDITTDKDSYLEACEKFALAVTYKEDDADAYYNWGTTLTKLGELTKDKDSYLEACEKFALAVTYKEDFAEAYNNWGITLGELGNLKKDEKIYLKACDTFHALINYYNLKEDKKIINIILGKFQEAFIINILNQDWEKSSYFAEFINKKILRSRKGEFYNLTSIYISGISKMRGDTLSKKEINLIRNRKGLMKETDIVIDAIIENKYPEYNLDEIPDNELALKGAVYLAKRITKNS
jgi:tetratricopeptide (TPR) repeat protein